MSSNESGSELGAQPAVPETAALSARPSSVPELNTLASDWQYPDTEEDFALPVITDTAGSVGVVWGPAGIQNWLEPPTGLPSPVGVLYRVADDGTAARVPPDDTGYQWSPWEVRRRHPVVSTRTRLHWHLPAVTEALTFNEPGRYAVVFSGLCRTWSFAHYWNLPATDVPQLNVRTTPSGVTVGDNKTFGSASFEVSVPSGDQRIRLFLDQDEFLAGRETTGAARVAAVYFEVERGDTVTWVGVQGSEAAPEVPPPDETARQHWERFWNHVFTPGNPEFSGSLPALTFDDPALDRLYYTGVLSLLSGRRRHRPQTLRDRFATGGQAIWADTAVPLPVAWTTGATEGAATTSFIWELHLVAPLLAQLDPDLLRDQLEAFLTADLTEHWGIEVLTGRPVGMWYAINDTAIVAAAADYLQETGDLDWLRAELGDGTRVGDRLLTHVHRHEQLADGGPLADYGPAENLLECVSTYRHRVAAFNAMAAWCYRFAADVLDPGSASDLVARAEAIEQAVIELATGDGVFRTGDGEDDLPVRTALDFIYVGTYLQDRVPDELQREMLGFFRGELLTSDWMRALSTSDPDSRSADLPHFQAMRADHQSTGSYDAWPAMAAAVWARWDDPSDAADWLRRVSDLTSEGPFGQAHRIADSTGVAAKASFVNGNCYLEVCGSRFAVTLLELAGRKP